MSVSYSTLARYIFRSLGRRTIKGRNSLASDWRGSKGITKKGEGYTDGRVSCAQDSSRA